MDIHELLHTEIQAETLSKDRAFILELRHDKRTYSFPLIYRFELETLRANLKEIINSINRALKD